MIELAVCGRVTSMVDPRHLAQEAAQRERRAWLYLSVTTGLILALAFGFIWLTW
jgi:hypothetical protein